MPKLTITYATEYEEKAYRKALAANALFELLDAVSTAYAVRVRESVKGNKSFGDNMMEVTYATKALEDFKAMADSLGFTVDSSGRLGLAGFTEELHRYPGMARKTEQLKNDLLGQAQCMTFTPPLDK